MSKNKTSADSLIDATRYRASFSGHGAAKGAAGERMSSYDPDNCEWLTDPGQSIAVNPGPDGFEEILFSVDWDNVVVKKSGFFGRLFKKMQKAGVDLDLGCMYELQDGTRGAIQAFGEKFGDFDKPPFLSLSGDERTGDTPGHDEVIHLNGKHWDQIKRVMVYIYIYDGALKWSDVKPKVFVDIPGEDDLLVTLRQVNDALPVCAVGEVQNIRGGIKLINHTEFFPGHEEMDRAFGFGLDWGEGKK